MNANLLTPSRVSGKLAVPNTMSGGQQTPFLFPQGKEEAPEKALLKVLHIMPCRKSTRREHGYIGRVQRPVSVKTRQPLIGLGSVVPCLFFYSQNNEVPMADKTFQTPTGESPQLVRCKDCAHLLPVNEHRRKARCVWTGERLDAGEVERARECFGFEEKAGEDLTSAGVSGMVGFPKSVRGVAIAVSSSPTVKKVLPAYSAVEALTISSGRLSYIGGIITSRTREGLAVSDRLGSVVIPPLLFNPKLSEVPHA